MLVRSYLVRSIVGKTIKIVYSTGNLIRFVETEATTIDINASLQTVFKGYKLSLTYPLYLQGTRVPFLPSGAYTLQGEMYGNLLTSCQH